MATGPERTTKMDNTNLDNNEIVEFNILEELANLGTLVDIEGVLVSIETYIKYVGEEVE